MDGSMPERHYIARYFTKRLHKCILIETYKGKSSRSMPSLCTLLMCIQIPGLVFRPTSTSLLLFPFTFNFPFCPRLCRLYDVFAEDRSLLGIDVLIIIYLVSTLFFFLSFWLPFFLCFLLPCVDLYY